MLFNLQVPQAQALPLRLPRMLPILLTSRSLTDFLLLPHPSVLVFSRNPTSVLDYLMIPLLHQKRGVSVTVQIQLRGIRLVFALTITQYEPLLRLLDYHRHIMLLVSLRIHLLVLNWTLMQIWLYLAVMHLYLSLLVVHAM